MTSPNPPLRVAAAIDAVTVQRGVGANIRAARVAVGLTLAELGESVGELLGCRMPRQAVHAAEKGGRQFTAAELVAYAESLDVEVGELFVSPDECIRCAGRPPEGYACLACGKEGWERVRPATPPLGGERSDSSDES